jgi:hypothetical protein
MLSLGGSTGSEIFLDSGAGRSAKITTGNTNGVLKFSMISDNNNTAEATFIIDQYSSNNRPFLDVQKEGTSVFIIENSSGDPGNVGIGTTTPSHNLTIADASSPQIALTDASATSNPWTFRSINGNFYLATSSPSTFATSSTPVLAIVTNNNVATTSLTGGFDVNSGAVQYDVGANVTSIERLDTGPLSFEADAGVLSWIDLPVTSASASNTPQSYTAQIDSNAVLTVYGLSDGAGAANTLRVGIATTTPWRTLSVGGNVGFSSALGTGTGGNYLCIDTTTWEVLRGDGSACTASSERFKENIEDLSYGIEDVRKLHPVLYNYTQDSNLGTGTKLGFIAEEIHPVIPEVVTYDNQGNIFGIDYPILTSLLTKAIQDVDLNLLTIASTTASSTPESVAFADAFFEGVYERLRNWFSNAANGIGNLIARTVSTQELCVTDGAGGQTCITKTELDQLLASAGTSGAIPTHAASANSGTSTTSTPLDSSASNGASTTTETGPDGADIVAPVITLFGDNPTYVEVGATYVDEGASALDDRDGDLPLVYFVDGFPVTEVTIDTSTEDSHIITYKATDAAGNSATATRAVHVGGVAPDGTEDTSTTTPPTTGTSTPLDSSASNGASTTTPPADTTSPEITLLGAIDIELILGDTWTDPGATAEDDTDGDLTDYISVSGSVLTETEGLYTLTYSVEDAAGNSAEAIRYVSVTAPEPEPEPEETATSTSSTGTTTPSN